MSLLKIKTFDGTNNYLPIIEDSIIEYDRMGGTSPGYVKDTIPIYVDDNYIYHSTPTNKIRKIDKFTFAVIGESIDLGYGMNGIQGDATHIFISLSTNNSIKKVLKSNLSVVATSSVDYGGNICCMYVDDTHVYVAGGTVFTVVKYLKSDMTYVATSPSYGATIQAIDGNATNLFIGGATTNKIYKLLKSDMSKVSESLGVGGNITALTIDASYIYIGANGYLSKYNISDLSLSIPSILGISGSVIKIYNNNLYVTYNNIIAKYTLDLLFKTSSIGTTAISNIYGIDTTGIYCGNPNGIVVFKDAFVPVGYKLI